MVGSSASGNGGEPALKWGLLGRIAGAVVLLAALALCLTVWWFGKAAARAYNEGQFDTAQQRYTTVGGSMPFERWKALFGEGTAALAANRNEQGEEILTEALEAGPPEAQECVVRINLYFAKERLGDQLGVDGDYPASIELYKLALETLQVAKCPDKDPVAAEAERRLQEKLKLREQQQQEKEEREQEKQRQQDGDSSPPPAPNSGQSSGSPSPSPDGDSGGEASQSPHSASPSDGSEQPASPSLDPKEQRNRDELQELNRRGQQERNENRDSQDRKDFDWNPTGPIW